MYLIIVMLHLLGPIISGFFGRKVGINGSHIISIGNIIYTSYPLWLILTSLILLLAMVGSIVITLKSTSHLKKLFNKSSYSGKLLNNSSISEGLSYKSYITRKRHSSLALLYFNYLPIGKNSLTLKRYASTTSVGDILFGEQSSFENQFLVHRLVHFISSIKGVGFNSFSNFYYFIINNSLVIVKDKEIESTDGFLPYLKDLYVIANIDHTCLAIHSFSVTRLAIIYEHYNPHTKETNLRSLCYDKPYEYEYIDGLFGISDVESLIPIILSI